jgi:hypothetical protein
MIESDSVGLEIERIGVAFDEPYQFAAYYPFELCARGSTIKSFVEVAVGRFGVEGHVRLGGWSGAIVGRCER